MWISLKRGGNHIRKIGKQIFPRIYFHLTTSGAKLFQGGGSYILPPPVVCLQSLSRAIVTSQFGSNRNPAQLRG